MTNCLVFPFRITLLPRITEMFELDDCNFYMLMSMETGNMVLNMLLWLLSTSFSSNCNRIELIENQNGRFLRDYSVLVFR